MANGVIRFIDGFDHYATDDGEKKWDIFHSSNSIQSVNPSPRRVGTKYLKPGSYDSYKTLDANYTHIIFGVAFYVTATSHVIGFYNSSGRQFCIEVSSDGKLQVKRNGTVVVETAPGVILFNAWQYLEIMASVANAGSIAVRLNEQVIIAQQTVDIQDQSTAGITKISLYPPGYNNVCLDDLYFATNDGYDANDYLGDCRVDTILAVTPDIVTEWDTVYPASPTTHFDKIDDGAAGLGNIDDDETYIETPTVDDYDIFDFEDVAALVDCAIVAAAVNICARKDEGSDEIKIKPVHKKSTTHDLSSEFTLTQNYKVYQHIEETDPDDSSAWTEAKINASKWGAKLTYNE